MGSNLSQRNDFIDCGRDHIDADLEDFEMLEDGLDVKDCQKITKIDNKKEQQEFMLKEPKNSEDLPPVASQSNDLEDIQNEFDYYMKFSSPYVLKLTSTREMEYATAWIHRLNHDTSATLQLKLKYLKLLFYFLLKQKLAGIFTNHPKTCEKLEEIPENVNHFTLGDALLKQEEKKKGSSVQENEPKTSEDMPKYKSPNLTSLPYSSVSSAQLKNANEDLVKQIEEVKIRLKKLEHVNLEQSYFSIPPPPIINSKDEAKGHLKENLRRVRAFNPSLVPMELRRPRPPPKTAYMRRLETRQKEPLEDQLPTCNVKDF